MGEAVQLVEDAAVPRWRQKRPEVAAGDITEDLCTTVIHLLQLQGGKIRCRERRLGCCQFSEIQLRSWGGHGDEGPSGPTRHRSGVDSDGDLLRGPGESVRHHIHLTRCVDEPGSEFSDEGEMALLSGRPFVPCLVESESERAMVGPNFKISSLQEGAEVADAGEDGEELPVKGGVVDLGLVQLRREEAEGAPGRSASTPLLQDRAHM